MTVLGIESSCDETGAAVVRDGTLVLSSFVASQHDLHAEYAGVVPEIASRAHVEALLPAVRSALSEAGVGLGWIDAVAVGNRPGLIGSLLVGVAGAKALAWSLGKPLIGVDHVRAHLYSGVLGERDGETERRRDEVKAPAGVASGGLSPSQDLFPALGLVVSGGHTAIYHLESWTDIRRLGATIDDAIGEAFDKVATILGLPHPGGPNLDRLAAEPGAADRAIDLPVSRLAPDSLDFSFSGLKTAVLYEARGVPGSGGRFPRKAGSLGAEQRRDLAASFQRAACAAVVLKLRRAIEQAGARGLRYRSLLTGGGVTANSRLRRELASLAAESGLGLLLPAPEYCVDNAAMIAGLGGVLLASGMRDDMGLQAVPTTA